MQYNIPTQQFMEACCQFQSFAEEKIMAWNFSVMKGHKTHETFNFGQAIAVFL
jgi:hypothetical protein